MTNFRQLWCGKTAESWHSWATVSEVTMVSATSAEAPPITPVECWDGMRSDLKVLLWAHENPNAIEVTELVLPPYSLVN